MDIIKKIRPKLPQADDLLSLLHKVIEVLLNENNSYRPYFGGELGSLLEFHDSLPTIIVPDLHARYRFLTALLEYKIENESIFALLEQKKIRLIFLGDGLHTEIFFKERWLKAFDEYLKGNNTNSYIKAEMAEGLTLMTNIMNLKIAYPEFVHFLKGNHENILNEESYGNIPFGKHVMEGEMVKEFMLSYYGKEITELYASFEYLLPLFVIGKAYLLSHAEPAKAYSKKQLIEAKKHPKIIEGLTWTKNNQVSGDAVLALLKKFQKDYPDALYFVGHRYVENRLSYRAKGKLVQLHNPRLNQFLYLKPGELFNEEKNLIELKISED